MQRSRQQLNSRESFPRGGQAWKSSRRVGHFCAHFQNTQNIFKSSDTEGELGDSCLRYLRRQLVLPKGKFVTNATLSQPGISQLRTKGFGGKGKKKRDKGKKGVWAKKKKDTGEREGEGGVLPET